MPDTLITMRSGLLGQVSHLLVGADGRVYVLDRQASVIHVVDPSGRAIQTIGRAGRGPGEFLAPTSVNQQGDTLQVVDWGNRRLQFLSLEGLHLRTEPLTPGPAPPTLGPSGLMLSPTFGFGGDSALAVIRGSDFTERARIGRTIGTTPNVVRLSELQDQIRRGVVPNAYLNTAAVVASPAGSVWLTVAARALVEQFDSTGTARWSLQVQDVEFDGLRQQFFSENARVDPAQMYALRYFLDTQVVGEDLWILLGQSAASEVVVRVIRSNGTLGPRYVFANVTQVNKFAVDARQRLIYFVRPESAELLRVIF